jgi:hypothetical protein
MHTLLLLRPIFTCGLSAELVLQQSCIPANDVWSFAMLMVATFSKGTELIDCNNNLASYRSGLERINRLQPYEMSSVPDGLRDLVSCSFDPKKEEGRRKKEEEEGKKEEKE